MKKKLFRLAAALLLSLSLLCVTAFAASEYGVIYDETGSLGSDTLTLLGENTLPMFSEQLGVELRVDVLTLMSADTIEDAAHSIYRTYGYGFGDDKRGVTLTIYMEPVGSTYAMAPGNWCIYVGGYDESFTDGPMRDTVTAAVEPYMADQAWNGDDLTMSATALTQATEAMLNSVSDYLLGEDPDSGDPVPGDPVDTEPVEDLSVNYVLDMAGLLDYDQRRTLEKRAAEIAAQYGCGVYAVTVEDYADYGSSIEGVIEDTYHQLELGEGSGRDGILLMLSMEDRDFATFVYGDQAEYAFNDYGLKQLRDCFLDNFADNDWYGGFADYLEECGTYLALAANGTPVQANPWRGVAIAVVSALLISLVICLILKGKMKSVSRKVEANAYVASGGLTLTGRQDLYTHTTETRRSTKSKSSDSFSGSGGGHGSSGKF